MTILVILLVFAVAAACWVGGSYFGMRRASRAQSSQTVAERKAAGLEAEIRALALQIEAEKQLLDRVPDPVLLLNGEREVVRMNAAAKAALGVGGPALRRHPGFRAALERALTTGLDQFADISLPVPIARELYVSVLPLDASRSRLLCTLADRTREVAVERMRADFVANASHELRTPLTSLIGFIETLRGAAADDPAAQSRFLGIMAEQAQRMNRLIDDLLSLSRIELTEHLQPSGRVDIPDLVDRIVAGFAPIAAGRVALETELAAGLPHAVGDEDQLAQVLQNLVENAIKYGRDDGFVRIKAVPVARSGQPGIALQVQDDGIGIAATHLPRLTERFYRVNTHRSRASGGTGLGLAIVKHIVNRHRGQLKIDSEEGSGTSVTVWLPAAAGAPSSGTRSVGTSLESQS